MFKLSAANKRSCTQSAICFAVTAVLTDISWWRLFMALELSVFWNRSKNACKRISCRFHGLTHKSNSEYDNQSLTYYQSPRINPFIQWGQQSAKTETDRGEGTDSQTDTEEVFTHTIRHYGLLNGKPFCRLSRQTNERTNWFQNMIHQRSTSVQRSNVILMK